MKKRNKGVTLIALAVTIIVMLILAGVTISLLTGENGIIARALDAKYRHQVGSIIEVAKLELASIEFKKNEGEDIDDNQKINMIYDKVVENKLIDRNAQRVRDLIVVANKYVVSMTNAKEALLADSAE